VCRDPIDFPDAVLGHTLAAKHGGVLVDDVGNLNMEGGVYLCALCNRDMNQSGANRFAPGFSAC